jgi:hypothetical protein
VQNGSELDCVTDFVKFEIYFGTEGHTLVSEGPCHYDMSTGAAKLDSSQYIQKVHYKKKILFGVCFCYFFCSIAQYYR